MRLKEIGLGFSLKSGMVMVMSSVVEFVVAPLVPLMVIE